MVAFNNANSPQTALFATDSPNTTFSEIYPGASTLPSDAAGNVAVIESDGVTVTKIDATGGTVSLAAGGDVTITFPPDQMARFLRLQLSIRPLD